MYTTLVSMLKKPQLYTKTTILFWDDEHISKQMLKAHLDPCFEGASRKHTFIPASNEPKSSTLDLGDCREGQRSSSMLRGL